MDYSKRLNKNDKNAFDELYAIYHHKVFQFSIAYLKNEDDAYDIVQSVFVTLWEKRSSLKKDSNFEAFLFTIVKNSVLSIFRKRSTERKYLDYLSAFSSVNTIGTEEITDYKFLKDKYEQLREQLPPKRKEIFLLSREKSFSVKEIAKQKGISEKTVADHITKSLSFFKQNMQNIGFWASLFYYMFIE